MKISEFANRTKVTIKMLRHYDEIGLLKPEAVNKDNGYRIYSENQEKYANWINILKHLDFSLSEIKMILDLQMEDTFFVELLKNKRIEMSQKLNERISKKVQIDRLIRLIEREGFNMDKKVDLMQISAGNVVDLLKNIPSMAHLCEEATEMIQDTNEESLSVMRMDIDHFKSVNDDFGHEVGDSVIAAVYEIFKNTVNVLSKQSSVARAGGDEFVSVFFGGENRARQIAESIMLEIRNYDFVAIGCERKVECSIGVVISPVMDVNLRNVIDLSIDSVLNAKKNGRNAIFIQ